jgi:hypothetical protein
MKVTVVAGDLAVGPSHDVLFVLVGPCYRAERLVGTTDGIAAAVVTFPSAMSTGTWGLGVEDTSELQSDAQNHVTGDVLLDLAVFTVSTQS